MSDCNNPGATHHNACDCREAEFDALRKRCEELERKLSACVRTWRNPEISYQPPGAPQVKGAITALNYCADLVEKILRDEGSGSSPGEAPLEEIPGSNPGRVAGARRGPQASGHEESRSSSGTSLPPGEAPKEER